MWVFGSEGELPSKAKQGYERPKIFNGMGVTEGIEKSYLGQVSQTGLTKSSDKTYLGFVGKTHKWERSCP